MSQHQMVAQKEVPQWATLMTLLMATLWATLHTVALHAATLLMLATMLATDETTLLLQLGLWRELHSQLEQSHCECCA